MPRASHIPSIPCRAASPRLPAPTSFPAADVVAYARNMHRPTTVDMIVEESDSPASGSVPRCPTIAVSEASSRGSASRVASEGRAYARI